MLAEKVLGDKALAADPNFATNIERVKRRAETDGKVAAAFGALDVDALVEKLAAADIAFGRVNGPAELARASASAPHRRRLARRAAVLPRAGGAVGRRGADYGPVPAHRRAQRKDQGGVQAVEAAAILRDALASRVLLRMRTECVARQQIRTSW